MLQVSDYNYLEKFYKKNFIRTSKKKYHKKKKLSNTDKKNLQNLKNNGFCVLKGVFQKKFINEINLEFQKCIKNLIYISLPRDLRFKKKIDINKNIENIHNKKLQKKVFFMGEKKFRNYTDSVKLKDPLVNIKKIIECSLNKRLIALTSNYFGCIPYLTYAKCVKTYKNKIENHDTQHFHIDENSVKLLKIFIYLNDVDSKLDGPFYYIKNSFKGIQNKWGQRARWEENKLKKIYGSKNFKPILAKKGDVIVANTVAFHKGLKPIRKDRNIIILNYGIHLDFTFNNKLDVGANILKKDYKKFQPEEKSILSLLSKI